VALTGERWRSDFVSAVAHNEYPLMHESSIPMFQIAQQAREDGVKVLLSGEGADELFGGYGFLHAQPYVSYLAANRRLRPLLGLAVGRLRREGVGTLLRGWRYTAEPEAVLAPHACQESVAFEAWAGTRAAEAYAGRPAERLALETELLRELSTYLPHLLNRQDKNTMQASIETRVPFLDPGVAALALCLPLEARMEPRRKGVLRDLCDRHLPREVARRPKRGFGFDVRRYLEPSARRSFLADGALRELLAVDRQRWDAAIAAPTAAQALRMWSAEVWCRLVPGGDAPEAVARELWA
jgi:asparagine synthase (glutamine-hydrolysing)